MHLLPHCFCLNLLVGRERLILLCLNETVCYTRFSHLACTANTTIMHNELLFVSLKLTQTFNVPPQTVTTQLANIACSVVILNLHGKH